MISIICGLGAAILFATSSLLSSRSVKIIDSWSVVAWNMTIGLVIMLPFVLLAGIHDNLGSDDIAWMAAAGIGNVTVLVCAALAFRVGKVGVITPILATSGALAAEIGRAHV